MLGGSTLLLLAGLPVAFTFIAVNIAGAAIWLGGDVGVQQLARNSVISIASFSLTPIPLFILMGEVLFHTGLAVKVIDGVERLIRDVPGRLAVIAVVAGTVFSAISGSTIARQQNSPTMSANHSQYHAARFGMARRMMSTRMCWPWRRIQGAAHIVMR